MIFGKDSYVEAALASIRKRRAAVKALLTFNSSELLSKTIGWAQPGQVTDRPLRIFEWCSLKVLVHFPQTILILDICILPQSLTGTALRLLQVQPWLA